MAGGMIIALDWNEISIASLHVASGRFASVLDPKRIVGFLPWQEVRYGTKDDLTDKAAMRSLAATGPDCPSIHSHFSAELRPFGCE